MAERYINLLTDFGFKRVFGTELNKALLIDFLNTILPEHHQIEDVTFKNSENFGNSEIDRKAIFDVYCQAQNGEKFIVEIQRAKQAFFKDRSVYYATFPIQEQAQKGDWNYELSSVYTVGVLDFMFSEYREELDLLHIIELKDEKCRVFYKKLKFIYLELPKFTKTVGELENQFDKWMFVLRYLASLEEPPISLAEGVFPELFEVAEIARFSPRERQGYQNSLKCYRDWYSINETLRLEAMEAGIEAGKVEVARNLLSILGDEAISQATGLSLEAVQDLRQVTRLEEC